MGHVQVLDEFQRIIFCEAGKLLYCPVMEFAAAMVFTNVLKGTNMPKSADFLHREW